MERRLAAIFYANVTGYSRLTGADEAGIAFMLMMANLLNRDFPPGLLQSFVDLPWPSR